MPCVLIVVLAIPLGLRVPPAGLIAMLGIIKSLPSRRRLALLSSAGGSFGGKAGGVEIALKVGKGVGKSG